MAFTCSARCAEEGQRQFRAWKLRGKEVCGPVWAKYGLIALVLICVSGTKAQNPELPDQGPSQQTTETPGKTSGNYVTGQTIEFGYRDSLIHGNLTNYDMFQDYASGWRLFDYDLDMHSGNHQGLLFDDLSFTNFGYGGDPNSVSRLRIDKNKWYDFRASYRRDDYLFNYNLFANPLNTSSFSAPLAISNSPEASQYVRHMQDYDVLLLPESRLRFRLGYSRVSTNAIGSTGYEPTTAAVGADVAGITNEYRMGLDYRGLPRTTLSFDELLNYTRVNTSLADQNFGFRLANGTAVDLGVVFQGTTPCAAPVTNRSTIPPTVTANCNGILSYGLIDAPRAKFPVEKFSFQSDYFKNFAMSGSAAYSYANNTMTDLNELFNGWVSRTVTRASTTAGPAQAKRVVADANWSGEYHITDKLSLRDEFYYHNWRIPSEWATAETNLFATKAGPGQAGLTLPISSATPANIATICPPPFTAASCPQHSSSSGPDVQDEAVSQFLGQDLRNNLIEAKYDFTTRVSGYIGYFYEARTIDDFSATLDTGEIYLPGGATGKAANDFLAARADCALVAGALPSDCSLNPATGVITEIGPESSNDTALNYYYIHENAAELGLSARPTDQLRVNADFMAGYSDNSFTRISPRQLQSYKIRATYEPEPWANITGSVDIQENRDNVYTVNNIEHGKTYSLSAALSPRGGAFTLDFGYSYLDVYTQTEICFPDSSALFTQPCPVAGASSPLGTLSLYESRDNYAYADVMWKPRKRVTALVGYMGSIVRGNTTFLNPLSPTGTLDFDYFTPYASLTFDLYKGVSYRTAWNYYGYQNYGIANPIGLAALPSENFNGNNITFVLRYVF